MTSNLVPNYPTLANPSCASDSVKCLDPANFGDIFSDQALYFITRDDNMCEMADKTNANFKMLADGFLLLAQELERRFRITFMEGTPLSYEGTFIFLTDTQKLYVWHAGTNCYIAVHGTNSINNPTEKLALPFSAGNMIPSLKTLRNISDGVSVNHFRNTYGAMEVTFVDSISSSCTSGLFIFDKSDQRLKIWSSDDKAYVPAYGHLSTSNPNAIAPSMTGSSAGRVEITGE